MIGKSTNFNKINTFYQCRQKERNSKALKRIKLLFISSKKGVNYNKAMKVKEIGVY